MKISSFATAFGAAATIFLGTMTNVVNSQTATWYECDTSVSYEIEWPDLPTAEEIVRILVDFYSLFLCYAFYLCLTNKYLLFFLFSIGVRHWRPPDVVQCRP